LESLLPVRLRDRHIPFVYFNRNSPSVAADSALVDSTVGLTQAADELVGRGHRRIAAIFGPTNTSTGSWRESVLRSALLAHGIHIPPELGVHGPFDFPTGFRGAQRLLASDPAVTAIMCGNDVVALGALNAAADLGIRVPDDVSIVGFDDLPAASWPIIQLTTVAFDLDAMARAAARLLVRRLGENRDGPYTTEIFDSWLVLRRTLGAAPARR
jgi:LacI family transcriptional regulator